MSFFSAARLSLVTYTARASSINLGPKFCAASSSRMSSSITQSSSFTAFSCFRRSAMAFWFFTASFQVAHSSSSSSRTFRTLASSLMRSDLISRMVILSRTSPKETGTLMTSAIFCTCQFNEFKHKEAARLLGGRQRLCNHSLSVFDQCQPVTMLRKLPFNRIEVHRLQLFSNRPTLTSANNTAVQFTDWQHFCRSAREEGLVCNVHLIAGNTALFHGNVQVVREIQNGLAGNTFQARCQLWCMQNTVTHNEDVLARAFSHIAFVVQQQCFLATTGNGFVQRQHGVDVVAVRLGLAHCDINVMTRIRGGTHLNADLLCFWRHVRRPAPSGDHYVHFQVICAQTHAFGAQKSHRAQVGFVQIVVTDSRTLSLVKLFFAERYFHIQNVGGPEQTIRMVFQAKNSRAVRSIVCAHSFKNAEAVVQGVSQDVDFGFTPGNHFTIQPDNAIAISHRHSSLLLKKRFSGISHSSRKF